MTKEYTESKKYSIQNKEQLYKLVNLNNIFFNNDQRWISKGIILLLVVFQKYCKELIFDIINIINYNIVLKVLWFKKYDSQIN